MPLPKGKSGGSRGGDDPLALDIGLISPKAQEAGSRSPATNPGASALDRDFGRAGAASSLYGAAFLAAAEEEAAERVAQQERGLDLMAEQLTWHAHDKRARALRRVSTAAVFGNGGGASSSTVGTGDGGGNGSGTGSTAPGTPVAGEKRGRGRLAWLFGGGGGGHRHGHGHGEERPSPLRGQKGGGCYGEASLHGVYRGVGAAEAAGHGKGPGSGVAGGPQHNLIRTLTLWRDGRREEAELSVKELLRYIQAAVRAVQQREQQALTAAGLTTYLAPGTSGGIQRGASLTRRPSGGPYPMTRERSQGSRVASHRAVEDPTLPPLSSHHYHLHHHALSPPRSLMGSLASTLGLGGSYRRDPPPQPLHVQAAAAALAGMSMGKKEVGILNARDVRRLITGLDSESARSKEMSVAVRRHTIVLNLDELRCLLLYDRLIVIVPEGADPDCYGRLDANLNWLRVQRRAFSLSQKGGEEEEDGNGGDEPFELLALEAALMTMAEFLQSKIDLLQPRIAKTSRALLGRATLATKQHDMLRQLKNKVALYQNKGRSLHKAILHLLEDEDDLHSLHLTRTMMRVMEATMATTPQPPPAGPAPSPASPPVGGRTNHNGPNPATPQSPDLSRHDTGLFNYPPLSPDGPASAPAAVGGGGRNGGRYREEEEEEQQQQEQEAAAAAVAGAVAAAHTEAEELLESYLADLYEIIMKWELLRDDMQTTEEYVLMKLDMARNRLLTYGTIFALINMLFAFAAVVTGVFGMNLHNGVNTSSSESHLIFLLIIGILLAIMLFIGGGAIIWMKRSGTFVR